ncbi:MAG: MerR family transcriptional regulator [Parasporobacterium sp.]|nr:MerR family transcriptional regulator [Parasporobacterium sp.]
MSEYFTISELSRDFDIPVTTLRFYQRSNLLNPVFRDENNYGYYSVEQLSQLELITFLREQGLPVNTIRQIITDGTDHAGIMKILRVHRDTLVAEAQNLSRQISKINATEKLYDSVMTSDWHPEDLKVCIRSFDTRWFLVRNISCQLTGTGDLWHLHIKQYISPILKTVNYTNAIYSMGAVSSLQEYNYGTQLRYHAAFCEPTTAPIDMQCLDDFTLVCKDPGDYLVVRYKQGEESREKAYDCLIRYIRDHVMDTEDLIYDGIVDCFLPPAADSPRIYELHVKLL